VPNYDRILVDQYVSHQQSDNPLPLLDIKGICRRTQPGQERREGLGQAQIDCPIVDLLDE
jgi:hypothetical protein